MAGNVGLVEVVHTGTAVVQPPKHRLWSNGELLATGSSDVEPGFDCDGACVVESYFDTRDAELVYWDPAAGSALTQASVDWGQGSAWWSVDRRMFDAYAPVDGVPDATFFARIQMLGLALDPTAPLEIDVRLEDGFPVGGEEQTRAPASPEVVINGRADEVLAWCTGEERLIDLPTISLDTGSPFIMGVLAGTLLMAGGFTVPTELTRAASVLVSLVDNHRRALADHGPLA